MLPNTRPVLWFILRLACWLSLLMYPWARVGIAYSGVATALGNLLLGDTSGQLHFVLPPVEQNAPATLRYSTELEARRTAGGQLVQVPIDLRTLTYIPTVVFIALTFAAPIWSSLRGLIILGSGLALLHAFLVASLAVPLVLFFSEPQPMPLLELGAVAHGVLDILYRSLVAPPGMAYAVPCLLLLLLLWLIPGDRSPRVAGTVVQHETALTASAR